MTGTPAWAEKAVDRFFAGRQSPSRSHCNDLARSLSGLPLVKTVRSPGSLSYTVICYRDNPAQELVVSFREPGGRLDTEMLALAKHVHGGLVPEITLHGLVEPSDPPLSTYTMPLLPGSSCIEVLPSEVHLEEELLSKHTVFIEHLARYFARCWCNAQPVNKGDQTAKLNGIRRRLSRLEETLPTASWLHSLVAKVLEILPSLFEQDHPQVLTHGDLSVTNILVDEDSFELTGIVD